ncbi:MAG: hypothetical protein ABT940_00350 [Alphaproteobacteria bacterium]
MFTGLPRKQEVFHVTLQAVAELQADGLFDNIFISTWTSEFETFRDWCLPIVNRYPLTRVTLLAREPPHVNLTLKLTGNPFHVLLSINHVLQRLPQDDWLLRTRSDIALGKKLIVELVNRTRGLPPIVPGPTSIYQNRVWTTWMDPTNFFYLGVDSFFATVRDFSRFIDYDAELFVRCRSMGFHTSFHFNPLKARFPTFIAYIEELERYGIGIGPGTVMPDASRNHKCYVKLLALYWKILADNYCIYNMASQYGFLVPPPGSEIVDDTRIDHDWPEDFDGFVAQVESLRSRHKVPYCSQSGVLDRVLAAAPRHGGLFAECLEEINRGDLGEDDWWRQAIPKFFRDMTGQQD